MVEQLQELVQPIADSATPVRTNRGWFLRGDQRINREGRPHGSKAPGTLPGTVAKCADRVRRMFVPEKPLRCSLTQSRAPWIVNLPGDFEIVDSYVDADRRGVYLIIRSREFDRVAKGTTIPEFEADFNGLMYCR